MKSFKFKDEYDQIVIINFDGYNIELWGDHVYRGYLRSKNKQQIIWNDNLIPNEKNLRLLNRFFNNLVFS